MSNYIATVTHRDIPDAVPHTAWVNDSTPEAARKTLEDEGFRVIEIWVLEPAA